MNLEGLEFHVKVSLSFTGRELWLLGKASAGHYDGKCQALSRPGGLLWGLANSWGFDERKDGPALLLGGEKHVAVPCPEEGAGRACSWTLSAGDVDTLCKACESWQYFRAESEAKDCGELCFALKRVLAGMGEVHEMMRDKGVPGAWEVMGRG